MSKRNVSDAALGEQGDVPLNTLHRGAELEPSLHAVDDRDLPRLARFGEFVVIVRDARPVAERRDVLLHALELEQEVLKVRLPRR